MWLSDEWPSGNSLRLPSIYAPISSYVEFRFTAYYLVNREGNSILRFGSIKNN